MSPQEEKKPFRILAPVFPGFNILDLTGPAEVFGNSRLDPSTRSIQIASSTPTTTSHEGITVNRDITYEELEKTGLEGNDMLLVPGAAPQFVLEAIEKDTGLMDVVRGFAVLEGEGKWLFSVCTGALFLGAAGLLAGRTATTHWASLDMLKGICEKAGGTEVVRKRFVDGGRMEGGVRVVNAGGVSCGIDAALWIVKERMGVEVATTIAGRMDYEWKFEGVEMEVTEGYVV
ncbi:hypothetical protein M409DRAFT_20128 [Zasmidium cellare ATCC 36951]|uniref:DJ-1/PfpI domain-containing protein n=1 Tax=Zasmidium cellare ATCC 36951 TaxID=1080233 RepID=A0A6A6CSN4_ZASCE|nr:uncharacterized protein M409DRAFT_20128 [Zasmidium cellare ATCC 36951]KAF2169713.1 hypothetical protein M409DRAFT_20128 [Zasmidium cellare ATCC 36951]